MNADSRPQRRRKSSLAGEHPAYPATAPQQATQQQQPPSPGAGSEGEARARTAARDAAYGWAATRRKLDQRTARWARDVEAARQAGTLPGVLREQIGEAAERAGIPLDDIPDEVWRAAGIEPR